MPTARCSISTRRWRNTARGWVTATEAIGHDANDKSGKDYRPVSSRGHTVIVRLNNGYGVTQFYHGTVYPSGTQYFAGAQDNGTQRGSDGSPNGWTSIDGGDGGWTAIDRNTSGSSTVLYAEFTGISIQKSTNNGSSFSDAVSGIANTGCGLFINPFQMDPNSTQRLFTSSNVLWRTSNAAGTWTQASAAISGSSCTGSDNGERFSNYAVAPGNSSLLIAGTNLGHICRLTNATSSTGTTAGSPAGRSRMSSSAYSNSESPFCGP